MFLKFKHRAYGRKVRAVFRELMARLCTFHKEMKGKQDGER